MRLTRQDHNVSHFYQWLAMNLKRIRVMKVVRILYDCELAAGRYQTKMHQ